MANPPDVAITRFLEETGSECYVYATTTFDPKWMQQVMLGASESSGWIAEGNAWVGSKADAAVAFGSNEVLAEGPESVWIMTVARGAPRAVELRVIPVSGGTLWVDADFVAAADCKDTL